MNKFKLTGIIILVTSGLNSCVSTPQYTEPEVHIGHSSPDVISLYNKPAKLKPKPTVAGKIGSSLLDGFIDGIFSSSPDDDDHFGHDRYSSRREKHDFTRKNKPSIQKSLRNKQ